MPAQANTSSYTAEDFDSIMKAISGYQPSFMTRFPSRILATRHRPRLEHQRQCASEERIVSEAGGQVTAIFPAPRRFLGFKRQFLRGTASPRIRQAFQHVTQKRHHYASHSLLTKHGMSTFDGLLQPVFGGELPRPAIMSVLRSKIVHLVEPAQNTARRGADGN